ncbi:MAG: hypothetical protein Q8918_10530 [Bacteroidota bacterium]|nr:hypothetical protein [Bacteroidota bacterium]MDP4212724.1 hypothetical protein [Bacteroidota bacterium]MDP4250532.1 hypothetical protein [Bacteroidota bacterium]
MTFYRILTFVIVLLSLTSLQAQHKHDSSGMMNMEGMNMSGTDMAEMEMPMNHSLSANLPMSRDGSGTSWAPDASPMYGYMLHAKSWMFMFHGDIFPRFTQADVFKAGTRGAGKWDAPDMLMAMGQRKIGNKGLFHFNVMLSTDALIAGGNGYPLLFQTGESWKGKPLVDRQHPHDLFSELSISYAYALSKKTDIYAYFGYPGEPALGPVAFMHRPSAMFMPDAPIGHHWEDATHITFGVATVGFRYDRFKLEGSSFTGREPDENRYNFDKPRFDSWSGRLSFNPDEHWALQVSHGFIKSPESLSPGENINRTTASATYVNPLTSKSYMASTVVWGQNKISGQSLSNSVLLEATWKLDRLALYARYEWVQKSVEELALDPAIYGKEDLLFPANAFTAGLGYDLFSVKHIIVAGGGQLSLYKTDATLGRLYGNAPLSAEVFLHIYPGRM